MTPGPRFMKILVAEDDELIGELLTEMLVEMGHDVCDLESTEQGTVAAARQYKPDLLVVDFQLSPGNGLDAVEMILQTQAIPYILVSGNIARVRERWPEAILLEKPYTQKALASAIGRAGGLV